jgi:periplasmic protein TonB
VSLSDGPSLNIERASIEIDTGLQLSNASISATDGDMLPLVAIAPQYPTRAAQRGVEGWCLVSFTVNGLGNVVEESIVVVDAEPTDMFDRSSIRAAARFKFQPRVVDGQGVAVEDVQYVFRYELEDN